MKKIYFSLFAFCFSLAVIAQPEIDFSQLELVKYGRNINTHYHESAPVISPDGNILYFFVADHPQNKYGKDGSQDIWYSEKDEYGNWGEAIHAPAPLNNHRFNQVFSVLEDGTVLLRGGNRSSDGFSLSKNVNGKFTNLQEQNIKGYSKMNKGKFSGACLSPDGKVMILYFNEVAGAKYSDLYVSFHEGGNNWSAPQALPGNINTRLDEFGPFIAADNKTMYFATNRPGGLGSTDIYYTIRQDDTWLKWSNPVNLGPPVNTDGFDAYFSIDQNGNVFTTRAYMSPYGGSLDILGLKPKEPEIYLAGKIVDKSSNRGIPNARITYFYKGDDAVVWDLQDGRFNDTLPGTGKYTIRVSADGFATIDENINIPRLKRDTVIERNYALVKEETKFFISGFAKDEKTGKGIAAKLVFKLGNQTIASTNSREDGFYEIVLSQVGEFELTGSKENYLNKVELLSAGDMKIGESREFDILLRPIEVGTTVRLNNIFFDFNAATLRPESFPELDKVVSFLIQNRNISVEIGGHTDGQGSVEYNEKLSQGRAESVRKYLISEGIPSGRITAKGYGKSVPIATNDTDEGRQLNRRVEFKVLTLE